MRNLTYIYKPFGWSLLIALEKRSITKFYVNLLTYPNAITNFANSLKRRSNKPSIKMRMHSKKRCTACTKLNKKKIIYYSHRKLYSCLVK